MQNAGHRVYLFDSFILDLTRGCLLREGREVKLRPKSFQLLCYLVENGGRLIGKEELIETLWPDSFVTDDSLLKCLKDVRGALGDNAKGFVKTVPRRGYILVANVSDEVQENSGGIYEDQAEVKNATVDQERGVSLRAPNKSFSLLIERLGARPLIPVALSLLISLAAVFRRHKRGIALVLATLMVGIAAITYWTGTAKPIDSVAILPFINANADPNTEYLCDGIPESIINSLSQLPHIKVMSRNSVFRFKGREVDAQEVGQKLGVRAVLTGRVAQRGDALAISIELVDARDNSQLWGQQYNRRLTDVFALQEEMAEEISERMRLKLSGAERQQLARRPTENLKAFQYYMQGRSYMQRRTHEDQLTAIRYCERAMAEDSNYALAYAGLADAFGTLGVYGYIAPIEGRRKEEEKARQALALDENLAEGHVALGHTQTSFSPSNFLLGDRELRRAIELSPSLALAHFYLGVSLVRRGQLDEGLAEYLKARELDPLASNIARNVAAPYYLKRDYGRALELLRQANELGPTFSTTWETGVYIQNRLFNETLAELEQAQRERKNDSILTSSTGMLYAARGDRAEALQIIKELEALSGASLSQAHWIAKIYATLNEKELALTWLDHGLAAGAIGPFLKDEPVWDTIRSDPRFTDLLRR